MGKAKVPPIYLQFVGAGLQVIGIALMSRDDGTSLSAASYGYEVIAGLGVGISIISTTIIAPFLITNPVDLCMLSAFHSVSKLTKHSTHHSCCRSVPVSGRSAWSSSSYKRHADPCKTKAVDKLKCRTSCGIAPIDIGY